MPDIESYLRGLKIPNSAKADLWDAYMESPDENALASRVKDYGVDSTVKADLWDMKAGRPLPQAAKTEASAAKGLARAVLGQQFRPPAMPKPPAAPVLTDPDALQQDELLSMPATPDPAGWRTLKEIDATKNIAPPMPKMAVPFGLQRIPMPASRSDIGDVGMAMGDTGEGLRRMAEFQAAGAKEAAAGAGQMVAPNQPLERRVMGATRVFQGGMQASLPATLPLMWAAAMAAPAATAFGLVAGTAAQEGVERGAKAAGVPEGYARAGGILAGLPGYLYGPFRALRPRVPTTTGVVYDAITPPASIADDVLTPEVLGPAPALAATPEQKLIGPPAARVRRAIVEADAPTKRVVPEPTGDAPVRPDAADGAPKPQVATKPAATTATVADAITKLQDGADAPVPIGKMRDAGLTDDQILAASGLDGVQLWESHLNAGHPDVQANPKDFLIRDGKAYNAAYYPPSPRRETQRGSFSRKPRANAKQPQGPEDDFLNFGRIKVTPDEESALRQTMRGMIDRGELAKDVEPHANIIQEAKRIHPDLVREVSAEAAKEGLTSRASVLSARERLNAISKQIPKHIKKRDDPSLDSAARAEIDGQIAAMENNEKEYLKITSGIRTNFGRNLASLKILADDTLDFGTWMYKAAKARGLNDASAVPDKDRSAIRSLIAKAEDAIARGDGKAADDAKFELARHVSKLQETGWLDTISALRKAGLLTGLRTHARNIGGNTLFAAMEEASRIPGAFTDIVVSAGTKRRTTAGPSISGMKNAAYEAATKGVEEARQIMSRGMTQADMKAGDLPKDLNFQKLRRMAEDMPEGALKAALGRTNDMVNTYVNTVFRSLGAEDRVFRVYAMRRSIEAQAKLKAMNENLSGAKLKARVAELTKNPNDLMISEAIAYSQFATFNTENSLAQMVTRGRPQLPAVGRAALDLVIPFVNTPMEVAARGSNYIPGTNLVPFARKGYAAAKKVSAAKQQMKRGAITKDEYATVKDLMSTQAQKAFSEAMGRGAVGTAIMLAGYMSAKEGKATGLREENDAMRTVKQAAGQQDGSVLVGGKWRQVSSFTPTATLFLMGASMYDQSTRKISNETKRPWIMAGTYAKAIADTPMLQGVGMAGDALKDPAKFGEQMISQTAGSFVPTAVSDLSRVIDSARKEFKPPEGGVFSPALYGIQGRLPFARSSQPNARDVFGKDLGGERSYAVDPFSSSTAKEQSDPMLKMMLDARVGIKPVDKITGESHAHYRGRQALAGAAIEKELRRINPERLPSDPEKRDKILKKAISAGRKKARTVWNSKRFLDNPEDRRAEILEQLAERVRGK